MREVPGCQGRFTFSHASFLKFCNSLYDTSFWSAYQQNFKADSVCQSHGRVSCHSHKRHNRTISRTRVWSPRHHLWSCDIGGGFRRPQPRSSSTEHKQEGRLHASSENLCCEWRLCQLENVGRIGKIAYQLENLVLREDTSKLKRSAIVFNVWDLMKK